MENAELPAEEFELKLTGNGIIIDRRIAPHIASAIMNLVLNGLNPQVSSASQMKDDTEIQVPLSLREYLDKVTASKKTDQIVAIGQYMSIYEGRSNFLKDDIKTRFSVAREPMPSNFPRDFNLTLKSGMVAAAHQASGKFYITKTGIQAVNRNFSSASKK